MSSIDSYLSKMDELRRLLRDDWKPEDYVLQICCFFNQFRELLFLNELQDSERLEISQQFSWAWPTSHMIDKCVEFIDGKRVLEIGAGNGLIAHMLQYMEVNIIPQDTYPKDMRWCGTNPLSTFTKVSICSISEAIKIYKSDVLFISYPVMQNKMAFKALKQFEGDRFIYIEDNTDQKFYSKLYKNWELVDTIPLLFNWLSTHGSCQFFRRKTHINKTRICESWKNNWKRNNPRGFYVTTNYLPLYLLDDGKYDSLLFKLNIRSAQSQNFHIRKDQYVSNIIRYYPSGNQLIEVRLKEPF